VDPVVEALGAEVEVWRDGRKGDHETSKDETGMDLQVLIRWKEAPLPILEDAEVSEYGIVDRV
jgi:hypothetical protein